MATTSNLSSIIRFYAEKQKSGFIDHREFCDYLKKYAEHHVEENAELVKYLGDPTSTVNAELLGLSEKHLVSQITVNNKKVIVSIGYFSVLYAEQYKEILKNESVPYPIVKDLPKQFPTTILEKKVAENYIPELIEAKPSKSAALYILDFARDIPSLLIPACVPMRVLIETSQQKIRKILKKEEYHDYFLKKLKSTNPTKEITIKNFFQHFVDSNENRFSELAEGEDYYIWNQTLYYIRQDFEKIQDKTIEDINILQAVQVAEIHSTYLKEKFQTNQKKEEALKELESNLAKPPFFYSMNQILKFQDNNGKLLFGRYSEEDLKNTMQRLTTEGESNELPPLLVFKVESGTKYFVYKKKVIQVVVRLCNEAHESIEKTLEEKWYNCLLNFEKLPEMSNGQDFERILHQLVEKNSPVLHSLLNANFMTLLAFEKDDDETMQGFQIFIDGRLLPYSDLLMLRNNKIYANAKMKLPFIYTIPVISWFFALFSNKKRKERKESQKEAAISSVQESEDILSKELENPQDKQKSKKEALAQQAKEISAELIPEGSTIDRELDYLIKQWNRMISKEAYNALTEDVNSLIRDYTRRVVKTLSTSSFTRERVENLAKTLVNTPNMKKIRDEKALTEYVTLYILRLVSNK